MIRALVRALYESGDLPTKAHAMDVYNLAITSGEDSVEAVADAMDFWGFDGSIAFDMALEIGG